MGYEKEQMILREEAARRRAVEDGYVCVCSEPLLTSKERAAGLCSRCQQNLAKDE
jgi:hypothetical protein